MTSKRSADTGNPAVEKYFDQRGHRNASFVVRDANAVNRPSAWAVKKAKQAPEVRGK